MSASYKKYGLYPFKFWARKLWKNNEGATAVEYALIAPVFFALLFSVFELGTLSTKTVLLDLAAAKTSKNIYIGSVSSGSLTKEDLEKSICDTISLIDTNCRGNLTVELTKITDFNSVPATDAKCVDADVPIKPTVAFNPGVDDEIIYMRICLTTKVLMPGIGFGLSMLKTDTGKTQLVTSLAFKNEPF